MGMEFFYPNLGCDVGGFGNGQKRFVLDFFGRSLPAHWFQCKPDKPCILGMIPSFLGMIRKFLGTIPNWDIDVRRNTHKHCFGYHTKFVWVYTKFVGYCTKNHVFFRYCATPMGRNFPWVDSASPILKVDKGRHGGSCR